MHHNPERGGRNRGRRGGRGQGRRGRGGGGGVQLPESQQLGTPDWERSDWTGSQISPNGYYHALHPYSPRGGRGGLLRRGGGGAGAPPHDTEHEYLETPIEGPHDPDESVDGQHASGGKKTRTKPIRNAEGVLIRKDGRPDMRSVSSANNLRKVHAKKEAERVDMEGRTPTSARSLAPADTYSDDEEEAHSATPGTPERDDAADSEQAGRHRNEQLMSRVFPRSVEGDRSMAERFFPRLDQHQDAPTANMKTEEREDQRGAQAGKPSGSSQMTDVVMREMSEAQAEEHRAREDIKMDTVEEANEQPGHEAERPEQEQQPVERSIEQ